MKQRKPGFILKISKLNGLGLSGLFFMSEEIIVNWSFSWKKLLSRKTLQSSSEEHERNISIPTCTLVSGHEGRDQAET